MTSKTTFDLETFSFNGHTLQTVTMDGKLWFILHEVRKVLDLTAGGRNIAHLGEGETRLIKRSDIAFDRLFPAGKGSGRMTLLTEAGLYAFTLRAQRSNPAAREFQDWVTKEVLPRIRKNGGYVKDVEKVATGEVTAKVVQENLWMLWAATMEAVRENFFAPLLDPLLSLFRRRCTVSRVDPVAYGIRGRPTFGTVRLGSLIGLFFLFAMT